jgi:uncharacterized protein GlcG (DUF336 family)
MQTAEAAEILAAAKAHAESMEKNVSIMVTDAAGVPVVFERMEGAMPMTAILAEAKAVTSALTGVDSSRIQGVAERFPALIPALEARAAGRFVAGRGAIVLHREGTLVAVVAVSGATPDEDEEIARAGAAAVGL